MAWSREGAEKRRQAIEDLLRHRPGLSFRQIVKLTGIPAGSARHHLSVLIRRRRVWYTTLGNRLAHFTGKKPVTPAALREAVAVSFDRTDACIYLAVRDEGPLMQKEILARFKAEPVSTVQHRVKRLVRFGILDEQCMGRYHEYTVAEGLV